MNREEQLKLWANTHPAQARVRQTYWVQGLVNDLFRTVNRLRKENRELRKLTDQKLFDETGLGGNA